MIKVTNNEAIRKVEEEKESTRLSVVYNFFNCSARIRDLNFKQSRQDVSFNQTIEEGYK